MTCGRRRIKLAVMRAGTSAAASLAAVALRQLLRCSGCSALRPNGQLVRGYSLPVSAVVARQQLSHQRGGSDGRTSATTQIVKTLHSCLDATRLYRAVSQAARATRALTDFVQLAIRRPLQTPRRAVANLPGEVYFRGASPITTGLLAPRGLGGRDPSSEGGPA